MIPIDKRLIIVLGMHCSGTSTITCGLNVLGVDLGDNLLQSEQGDNPKGHFEDIDIYTLNIEMLQSLGSDWHCLAPIETCDVESLHKKGYFLRAVALMRQKTSDVSIFGFKDPRVAKLIPFWRQVFVHCGFDTGYVLAIRNPLSVMQSLANRNGFPPEKSYMLWLGHVLASLSYTEEHRRALIDYDHFLDAPQQSLEVIAERLALKINPQTLQHYISDFLDTGLRHSVYTVNDLAMDQDCPPLVQELYAALLDIASDNKQIDSPAFHASTAHWGDEFNRLKLNLRWIDQLSAQIDGLNQGKLLLENQLLELTEREKAFSVQLQEIQQEHWRQKMEQSHQHAEREQALLAQLAHARQQIETHLQELAEREKTYSWQLMEMQQVHEQQGREHAEREQAQLAQLAQARQQIESYSVELAEREKAFSQQLIEIHQVHEQQIREHVEREQAQLAQLELARQQIESYSIELAEREMVLCQKLQEIQQVHEQQNRENAEREQALNAQLLARQDELQNLTSSWAESEKMHLLALTDLQYELDAICSTYSWRWTYPLRGLAALVERNNSAGIKKILSKSNEAPAMDPVTNFAAHAIETRSLISLSPLNADNGIVDISLNQTRTEASSLDELLSFNDECFIHSAYHTLLGRTPDPEGMSHYLSRLQAGISKVEILAQLRTSLEGKSRQVKIAGLDEAVREQRQLKTSLLGRLLRPKKMNRTGKMHS